ncbi:MAG: histidine phosphatase family protein [Pseudomonadales bacterium]|nr:histidine phosphatase family protein [Pseudomonadales bacterium]
MTVKHIHLIRHGQTNWNKERRVQGRSESILTAEGKQQAQNLAGVLDEFDITRVYCSSSTRTRQTAEILFAGKAIPFTFCDQLREIYLGDWEGLLWDELQQSHPEPAQAFWHRPENFLLPGAETFQEVQQRAMARFRQIINDDNEHIAIISHGVLIKTILCYLEDRPLAKLWEPPHMHNCAHSIVRCEAGQAPRIIQYAGTMPEAVA